LAEDLADRGGGEGVDAVFLAQVIVFEQVLRDVRFAVRWGFLGFFGGFRICGGFSRGGFGSAWWGVRGFLGQPCTGRQNETSHSDKPKKKVSGRGGHGGGKEGAGRGIPVTMGVVVVDFESFSCEYLPC